MTRPLLTTICLAAASMDVWMAGRGTHPAQCAFLAALLAFISGLRLASR